MSDSQTPEFETDNGFLDLIQPRDEKYIEELEEDIFDHGCRDAVCVWGNTIIDGHLRYSICKKWDIRFNIRRLIFQSRDEAEATCVQSSSNALTLQVNIKSTLSADSSVRI